ncbi:unnamed protein product [Tuwongella immobilis]|uniref:Uncharacterized protein n=1 Tax=Tuwongella immobilis TaxID=692036 RepID=A0A6C2YHC9_9BACT|nr:unnamed protein product [Tuwongella immobilis]VTR97278.1 unnamed protein product [Tuwongella immobilis]
MLRLFLFLEQSLPEEILYRFVDNNSTIVVHIELH